MRKYKKMKQISLILIATILSTSSIAQIVQTKIVDNGGTGPYSAIVAKDASLPDFAIYRPQNLENAALAESKLPIVLFANGACVNSSLEYERLLTEVASHGYVIIAIGELQMTSNSRPAVEVDASLLLDALNWITVQAGDINSEYYNRVDINKISGAGHSCGGSQVISLADNAAFKSYIILNSGMGDMSMAGATPASLQNYHAPVLYIVGGETDVAYSNALLDYSRIDHVEVTLSNLINGGHSGTFWDPYGGSNAQMMLKWLDWRFKNATENCAVFLDNDLSEFPGWELFSKNYDYDCNSQPSNRITFSSPTTNVFVAPATITFDVSVSDVGLPISNIAYYLNNELIQEDLAAPYEFDYTIETAGDFTVRAVATDNEGNTAQTSKTLRINIPQGPYLGTAATIPGKIECENYDVGGNEFAYYDTDAGSNVDPAPDFRTDEDVDIETCADTGGGYNLGWTVAGEWLEYTVNVTKSGTYDIVLRASTDGDGKTISLSADGVSLANDVAVTNTAGWQEWTDITIPDIELQSGEQVLRLTIGDNDYVNLNYMTFIYHDIPLEPIQLTAGWNLIGCPLDGATEIPIALSSIWENIESVKDMDNFYLKGQTVFLNTLQTLNWGHGYLVKVSVDCELTW
jgi:hypothetical protein